MDTAPSGLRRSCPTTDAISPTTANRSRFTRASVKNDVMQNATIKVAMVMTQPATASAVPATTMADAGSHEGQEQVEEGASSGEPQGRGDTHPHEERAQQARVAVQLGEEETEVDEHQAPDDGHVAGVARRMVPQPVDDGGSEEDEDQKRRHPGPVPDVTGDENPGDHHRQAAQGIGEGEELSLAVKIERRLSQAPGGGQGVGSRTPQSTRAQSSHHESAPSGIPTSRPRPPVFMARGKLTSSGSATLPPRRDLGTCRRGIRYRPER